LSLTILSLHPLAAQKSAFRRSETFPVGNSPEGMTSDGTNLWVTSAVDLAVTELRVSDGTLVATVPIGAPSIAMTFDGTYIWVLSDSFILAGVTRIRAADGTIEGVYPIGNYSPEDILFDGKNVWISSAEAILFKLRDSDAAEIGKVVLDPEGASLSLLAFDGANIWATNAYKETVTKVRTRDGAIQGIYPSGNFPGGIAFDGAYIWMPNTFSDTVTKLRASDGALVDTILVGLNPFGAKFDGKHIWIANDNLEETAQRLDPRTDAIDQTYSVGDLAGYPTFDGTNIWFSNFADGTVSKIGPRR
jgi:hypothetical protein